MGLFDHFRPVSAWTTDQVAAHIRDNPAESYHLVDVRQPGEYEQGHLPGARLIPMTELKSRMKELDPGKPAITY